MWIEVYVTVINIKVCKYILSNSGTFQMKLPNLSSVYTQITSLFLGLLHAK
jgi:hypothetical protein